MKDLKFNTRCLATLIIVLTISSCLTSCVKISSYSAKSTNAIRQVSKPYGTAETSATIQVTLQKYSYSFTSSFDTVIMIIGYSESKAAFDQMAHAAEEKFIEYHQLFDIYHEYPGINNLMTINNNAGKGSVEVDSRIIELIDFYLEHDRLAPDKVNIAMGSVLTIWHDHRSAAESGKANIPDMKSLKAAILNTDISSILIDHAASTVELINPLTRLDVGAVGKGYATESVAQYLKTLGMNSGIISAGGSNVRLIGKPADPERETWSIGIQNPFLSMADLEEKSIDVIQTNETSIVTSGDYQRFYTVDGVNYHHIIDPVTLMPARYMRAVSIMNRDSALADFLSTAVFLMPYEDGRKLIESIPNCEALWIFDDGSIIATDGMTAVLKDKGRANASKAAKDALGK
jgi:thiamine biosynthesis lipoprotein